MKKLNVDLKAYQMDNWCHGVLSFDLKIGGIPESHKANVINVQFFREIFDGNSKKIITSHNLEANYGILKSPLKLNSIKIKSTEKKISE